MIRLFVGLALPEAHRQQLEVLQNGISGARWVAPRNLHVTLRFVGEVDEDVAEDIAAALDLVHADPFDVTLKELGTFGRPPHALWVGVEDTPHGALAHLHAAIDAVLVRSIGLKPEGRKYIPHVTMARMGWDTTTQSHLSKYVETHPIISLKKFKVNNLILFESALSHHGAEYNALEIFDF
ncbi:MAG: RNA 2',3'-cyclic phosphodiesterase [Magnetovibrio sp.]|nr:RNA 2',3'-cyclic phosphodiesterase [Magnetovibrio sp.]